MNGVVISQRGYCIALCYGLPSYQISRLQRVQNTAARLISCSHKYDLITTALVELHWLPIEYWMKFIYFLHVFKAINGLSPICLTDLFTHQPVPSRSPRSTDSNLLFVPRTFSAFGDRCFSVYGPRLWNTLPPHVKDAESTNQFIVLLKKHFLNKHFLSDLFLTVHAPHA